MSGVPDGAPAITPEQWPRVKALFFAALATGDTAKGRSITAFSRRRPGKRQRTSSSETATPKIVLATTATRATFNVSFSAWVEASVVKASHTGPAPGTGSRRTLPGFT